MNSRERFIAAVKQQPVDRVPVCLWHHFTGPKLRYEPNVQAHVDFAKNTRVDVVKISIDSFFLDFPFDGKIKTVSDWRRLKPLDRNGWYFTEQFERAKRVNEELQADHPTIYVFFPPFSTMRHALGDEFIMAHMREDPQAVIEGMKVLAEDNVYLMRGILTDGCDGTLMTLQGAEYGRFTPEQYAEWIWPMDRIGLEESARLTDYSIAHYCGWAGRRNQLECWQDLPENIHIISYAASTEGLSIPKAKMRYPGKTIMGGFDSHPNAFIYSADEQQIKAETKRMLDTIGTKGFILSADCSLEESIPDEKIRWVVEAAEEYGSGQ